MDPDSIDHGGPFTDLTSWQSKCLNRRDGPFSRRENRQHSRNRDKGHPGPAAENSAVLDVPASRASVLPYAAASVLCFIANGYMFTLKHPSFILFAMVFLGAFGFLAMAVHDATLRHVLVVGEDRLVVRRQTVGWGQETVFTSIDDICLVKQVGGHGIAPLPVDTVRSEYERHGTHPAVTGLGISSAGTLHPVALHLPFEELLALADALRTHAREHGLLARTCAGASDLT